ncbi:MAG: 3-deoxy-8-phosphooctulonate synthase [Planctomycetota bacterium]
MTRPHLDLGSLHLGGGQPFLIAGPCVLESEPLALEIAERMLAITTGLRLPYIFKASFDKANRTSLASTRGPRIEEGLSLLAKVKERLGVPILTDVHLPDQCQQVAEVADVLQIPAFLCRQTDLLVAAAETGRIVNIKKGQFLAPWDARHAVDKVRQAGNDRVLLTERGTSFGYGRLVVDMNGLADLAGVGVPVVFDGTHSVQEPGGADGKTGGDRRKVPALARAAVATGHVDGLFLEVHPRPDESPSDAANMLELETVSEVLRGVLAVHAAVHGPRG